MACLKSVTHVELVVSGRAGGLEQHRRSGASPKLAVRDCRRGIENGHRTTDSEGRVNGATAKHGVCHEQLPGACSFVTTANQHGSEVRLTDIFRREEIQQIAGGLPCMRKRRCRSVQANASQPTTETIMRSMVRRQQGLRPLHAVTGPTHELP